MESLYSTTQRLIFITAVIADEKLLDMVLRITDRFIVANDLSRFSIQICGMFHCPLQVDHVAY